MFRITGFIIGSALAVASIFMVFGVPQLNLDSDADNQARFEAAIEKIREKPETQNPATEATPADNPPAQEQPQVASESLPEIADATEPAFDTSVPLETVAASDIANSVDMGILGNEINEMYWHNIWNPFHSEIAARGFVRQLEKVTGLDYRVTKVDIGVYQVGFAYVDESDRVANLSRISAATGLDLPGS